MDTQQKSTKKTEVYSVSGFRDTLASPVFYPVIVVALVLGVTSILGFVQNPLKLKSMVNVIHQKVSTSQVVNSAYDDSLYNISQSAEATDAPSFASTTLKSFDLFSSIYTKTLNTKQKMPVDKSIERIAFNYDVTSENFWTDLDSTQLETATEEMERKQQEAGTFREPLKINLQQQVPDEFNLNDKSIYALNGSSAI